MAAKAPRYAMRLDFAAADDAQAERLAAAWADTCAAEYATTYHSLIRVSDGAVLAPPPVPDVVGTTRVQPPKTAQVYLAHYWRHHVEHRDEHDSPDGAAQELAWGEEYGELSACCVIDLEGKSHTINVEYDEGGWIKNVTLTLVSECPAQSRRSVRR